MKLRRLYFTLSPLFQIYRSKSITGEVRGLKDVVLENTSSTMDFLGEALTVRSTSNLEQVLNNCNTIYNRVVGNSMEIH
jgi:hypothetical protein